MKTPQILKAKAYFLLALLTVSLVGCNKENQVSSSGSKYSGRDLFKGVFFAQGKVADELSSIKNSQQYFQANQMGEKQKQVFDQSVDELLDIIETKDPQYFTNFKSAIQSKNHLVIQKTLQDAAQHLYKTSIDTYLSEQEAKKIDGLTSKIDIEDYKNEDGSVDYDALQIDISQELARAPSDKPHKPNGGGITIVIGVIWVAYVAVLHAAALMQYVAVAWVGAISVSVELYVKPPSRGRASLNKKELIRQESLVDELVNSL